MEYCGGGSIFSIISSLKRGLKESELAYVTYRVLRGIRYLHATHRIHRDIKAGNILITDKGSVKIGFFFIFFHFFFS
jgi:serine/threonine protein kinase